jgi:hypothetical protein
MGTAHTYIAILGFIWPNGQATIDTNTEFTNLTECNAFAEQFRDYVMEYGAISTGGCVSLPLVATDRALIGLVPTPKPHL